MKRKLLPVLLCLVAMVIFNKQGNAQTTLIHYWHFNNNTGAQASMYTPTITPISADYTRITSRTASVLYTGLYSAAGNYDSYFDTVTSVTADYDTVNLQMGQTGGYMMRARNNSDSMQLLFYLPSTNYQNLVLTYGTESSSVNHGQTHQNFAYSVDSGSTWITSGSGLSVWTDSAWLYMQRVTVNITDPSANNNSKLIFRITFTGETYSVTPSGNNRFDNITLEGDTVGTSGINQIAIAEPAYTLYPNPVTNQLNINDNLDGNKSVLIANILGQVVFSGTEEGTHFSIDMADLNAGLYFITIRENNTGSVSKLKFIKQ